ncbi:DUF2029 domain-containing protein [bacterium]|nr:DUF2029 domain-containing protein [bacterium]
MSPEEPIAGSQGDGTDRSRDPGKSRPPLLALEESFLRACDRAFPTWKHLVLFVAATTVAKLWLLSHTLGSNDASTWVGFARLALSKGPVAGYGEVGPSFNHPFLGTLAVTGSLALARALGFPVFSQEDVPALAFFVRLPALLGDLLGTLALFHLLAARLPLERARFLAAAHAASPLVALAGLYHGNTDLLWVALVVLSALALEKERPAAAGALLAAAASVKVAALVALPALAVAARRQPRFAIGFLLAFLLFFVPPLAGSWSAGVAFSQQPFVQCVFGYRGTLTDQPWPPQSVLAFFGREAHDGLRRAAPFVVVAWAAAWSWVRRDRPASELVAVSIALSLLLAPTFGVQYLAWLALPVFFLGGRSALAFHVTAAVQAALIYASLGGFRAPSFYANSKLPHEEIAAWPSWATWLALLSILVAAVMPKSKGP